MGERSNAPSDAVQAATTTTVGKPAVTAGSTTERPPQAGADWVQSTIDPGTWLAPGQHLAWNGEQQQYNWTGPDNAQHSGPTRPPDSDVLPEWKPGDAAGGTTERPPTTADGWIPTVAQDWVLKHPTRMSYWDTKEHKYTWIDTDTKRHTGPNRPPDDQVKQDYSATPDDD